MMRVIGIHNPLVNRPGFCTVVAECDGLYFVQEIQEGNACVIHPFEVNQEEILFHRSSLKFNVNRRAIYGFYFSGTDIFIGDSDFLCELLSTRLSEFDKSPYLLRNIGLFVKDHSIVAHACSMIQDIENSLFRNNKSKSVSTEVNIEPLLPVDHLAEIKNIGQKAKTLKFTNAALEVE